MGYKDYSEYNEVDNVYGDDVKLQVSQMSDGTRCIEIINSDDAENSVILTSGQARAFADKLRRYADKVDGVKLP